MLKNIKKLNPLSGEFLFNLLNDSKKRGYNFVMSKYYLNDDKKYFYNLNNASEESIEESGRKMIKLLKNEMIKNVPAYRSFIKKNIKEDININDLNFKDLPVMTKDNYLKKFKSSEMLLNKDYKSIDTFSVSSGSSGSPYFWPRGGIQEIDISLVIGNMLRYLKVGHRPTLVIITFSMGMYIAGLIVSNALARNAKKGFNFSILTPGTSKKDFISIISNLKDDYDDIVIAGYPPLVKDLLNETFNFGIDLKEKNVKFIFAAESFSEEWRDYMHNYVNVSDDYASSLNIYGTADAGILGHETPLTNFIRKKASMNKELANELFSDNRLPSFVQYYPNLKFFEEIDGNLIFSTLSGYPLMRYNIKDSGGILKYSEVIKKLKKFNIDPEKEILSKGHKIAKLPFLYLFGRSDFTASFYGLNIYPEHIKSGLESNNEMISLCSGKFQMNVETDNKFDQNLIIRVELNNFIIISETNKNIILSSIIDKLSKNNYEFYKLRQAIGKKASPVIILHNFNDPDYFNIDIKQKWKK